jgi:hypothetical protein
MQRVPSQDVICHIPTQPISVFRSAVTSFFVHTISQFDADFDELWKDLPCSCTNKL